MHPRDDDRYYKRRPKFDRRNRFICRLYLEGKTHVYIAKKFGLDQARISHILRAYRVPKGLGGFHKQSLRERRCMENFGCTVAELLESTGSKRIKSEVTEAYRVHKSKAEARGIGWEFTFLTWLKKWNESGLWDQRRRGGACMARHYDEGPYSPDNVTIMMVSQNTSDWARWRCEKAVRSESGSSL